MVTPLYKSAFLGWMCSLRLLTLRPLLRYLTDQESAQAQSWRQKNRHCTGCRIWCARPKGSPLSFGESPRSFRLFTCLHILRYSAQAWQRAQPRSRKDYQRSQNDGRSGCARTGSARSNHRPLRVKILPTGSPRLPDLLEQLSMIPELMHPFPHLTS